MATSQRERGMLIVPSADPSSLFKDLLRIFGDRIVESSILAIVDDRGNDFAEPVLSIADADVILRCALLAAIGSEGSACERIAEEFADRRQRSHDFIGAELAQSVAAAIRERRQRESIAALGAVLESKPEVSAQGDGGGS